jgi:hypothetical protein
MIAKYAESQEERIDGAPVQIGTENHPVTN